MRTLFKLAVTAAMLAAGAFAATLAARARGSDKEIMLLAVGDTRDHRRVHKAGAYTRPLLSST